MVLAMTPIDSLTSRIGKLLAKAENTTSVAEAAALFAKAQQLASEHSIDMAVARFQHSEGMVPDVLEDRTLILGAARSLGLQQKLALWGGVADTNDVQYSVRRDKTAVNPVGFASDLDTAEQLYAVLVEQMVRMGDEYVRGRSWEGDTYDRHVTVRDPQWGGTYTEWKTKPVDAKVARRSFYTGYVQAVRSRLYWARMDAEDAAEARAEEAGISAAPGELSVTTLALVDKKEQVQQYTNEFFARTNVRGTVRESRPSIHTGSSHSGYKAGEQAAMSNRKAIG